MNDLDLKRNRIQNIAKLGGVGVVGFFVAPFIFIAIKGVIGLAVAFAVSGTIIQFVPYVARLIANWRLKAIKYEASKNPIETLQNDYAAKRQALMEFKQSIINFAGECNTFSDKLDGFKRQYPDQVPKFQTQYDNMRALLETRKVKYNAAKTKLEQYDQEIQKANAIWDMAQAAAKMSRASGDDTEDFLQKISRETALDSIQQSMGQAFGELEISLEDEKGSAKQVAPAKTAPTITEGDGPPTLELNITPLPERVTR